MMIIASIPLWLLSGFSFLVGCTTLQRLYNEPYERVTTGILLFMFPASWLFASAVGALAAWMVS